MSRDLPRVVLEGLSANSCRQLVKLVSELETVLARPLVQPVRSHKQEQRRLEPGEVAELVAAYRGGASMKELAKRHGIHRTTVASWLKINHCELRRQGISELELPEVIRLYVDGWSCQRLAERFDCDDETVRQALKSAGVVLRRPWERPV